MLSFVVASSFYLDALKRELHNPAASFFYISRNAASISTSTLIFPLLLADQHQ